MVGEDILIEIDGTINSLIKNAEIIQNSFINDLSQVELDAFQNTQESLLQHLLTMDQYLVEKKDSLKKPLKNLGNLSLRTKLLRFEKMRKSYIQRLNEARKKKPILSKRKRKRFLHKVT